MVNRFYGLPVRGISRRRLMSTPHDLQGRGARFALAVGLTSLALTASAQAAIVVNDSWVDAGRNNGTDPLDSLYGYFATPTAALPGYMMDMDVATGTEDLVFRQHDTAQTATTPTGRLLGTTTGFSA